MRHGPPSPPHFLAIVLTLPSLCRTGGRVHAGEGVHRYRRTIMPNPLFHHQSLLEGRCRVGHHGQWTAPNGGGCRGERPIVCNYHGRLTRVGIRAAVGRRHRRRASAADARMTDDESSCRRSYHCRGGTLTTEEGWEEKECSTSTSRCRGLPPSAYHTTEFFILTVCVWIMKFGGSGLPNFFAERNETMCT